MAAKTTHSKPKSTPRKKSANGTHTEPVDPRYPRGNRPVPLAYALAAVATGTVYAAAAGDKAFNKKVEEAGKWDRELDNFAEYEVPPEVRKWVRHHFTPNGDATEAIERQLAYVLDQALRKLGMASEAECWPFCGDHGG
jgi:hypothetical protein